MFVITLKQEGFTPSLHFLGSFALGICLGSLPFWIPNPSSLCNILIELRGRTRGTLDIQKHRQIKCLICIWAMALGFNHVLRAVDINCQIGRKHSSNKEKAKSHTVEV